MTMPIEILKSEHNTNLADLYMLYPYKTVDYDTPYPYVPKKERTDEEYSLTFKEWSNIVKTYYKYVLLYLVQGFVYRFTSGMGELKIVRYKSNKPVPDYAKIRKELMKEYNCSYVEAMQYMTSDNILKYKHLNKDKMGYRWNIAWFKNGYNFRYQFYWTLHISQRMWKLLDPFVSKYIHKIQDTNAIC